MPKLKRAHFVKKIVFWATISKRNTQLQQHKNK